MKKRLSLILCLCMMVLVLAACGENTETEYFNMKYADIQSTMEKIVMTLATPDSIEHTILAGSGSDAISDLIETWDVTVDDLGDFQGLGELTITKTQNTVTAEQIANYPGRQVVVSFVYTYDYGEEMLVLTDMSVDLVYTLGEKMEKAALNTLMGMGTVFAVLILISLLIYCFRFIPNGQTKKAPEKSAAPAPVPVAPVRAAEQLTDDLELVAAITAAIAASTGTSSDGFVVRSIRRR